MGRKQAAASAIIGINQDGIKDTTNGGNGDKKEDPTAKASRRNSVMATKRHSVIRLLSESEGREGHEGGGGQDNLTQPAPPPPETSQSWATAADNSNAEILNETDETDIDNDKTAVDTENAPENNNNSFYNEEIAEIDEMREEVDEARKLAEEWEAKYKEMQRQMSDVESSRYKIHSLIIDNVPIQKKASATTSEFEDGADYDEGDYTWMLKREFHSLNNKLRNVRDKRDIVIRERCLLQERIETLVGSIGNEVESRKGLRKEINEMNEAFKVEIRDMVAEQKAANDLEDCYFSDDEDLVINTHKKDDLDEDDWEVNDVLEEFNEAEDNVDDILKLADEDEDQDVEDVGSDLFENYPQSDEEDIDEKEIKEEDYEPIREAINKRVERHHENVQLMRRSNFRLKAKIDRLYDILQMQKEKHHDLRQELTRMLADIQ